MRGAGGLGVRLQEQLLLPKHSLGLEGQENGQAAQRSPWSLGAPPGFVKHGSYPGLCLKM